MSKLNDRAIKLAEPKAKPYKMSDGLGLYLEVQPTGSRYWRFKYLFAGKQKRIALGVYPEISLKAARDATLEYRLKLRNNIDPAQERKQEKLFRKVSTENNFEAVGNEWLEKEKDGWSENHFNRSQSLFKNHLVPWLGVRPVSEITAPELLAVLRKIESRGILETADRTKTLAGQIFRYAIQTGRAERDPSQDLKGALKTPKTKHLAAIIEPKEVGKLMRAIDSYHGTPIVEAALKISPLLFQRPGEIRTMKWDDIDFEKAEWRYIVSKTKTSHIVPLSQQALEILKGLEPITRKRSIFVFPSPRGPRRPLSENGVRVALRAMGYTNDQMTPHGFRAMARTLLDEELGYRVDWIEHQLAHAVRDSLGRAYNRTSHIDGRRQMMQGWADYLDALKSSATESNVHVASFRKIA